MRKIILGLAVSLDSFIEGPNGEYDWCFTDQDYGMTEFFGNIDAIFMGRKSYDVSNQYDGPSPWKGMLTYVFSRTLKEVPPDVRLINGDIRKEVESIRRQPGKDIWLFGGAELVSQLMNEHLVDELWLSVHPIILGSGKPLFQGITNRITTKLIESKTYETGLVSLKYQVLTP